MERYIAKAIAFDLALYGKRAIVCGSRAETREIVAEVEKVLHGLEDHGGQIIRTYSRAHGRERIDMMNGGMLVTASSYDALRGYSVNVVVMDQATDAKHEDWYMNAIIATNSTNGEVVRV